MVLGAVLGWLCLPILMVGASGQLDIGFGIACVLLAILGSVVGAWSGLGVSALLDRRRVAD
jgi:NO-binding membrane sensor protein with MHYT domain